MPCLFLFGLQCIKTFEKPLKNGWQRERPNMGFASAQLSFHEARQSYLSPLHVYFKFMGVAFFPVSRLPALVMERLLTSLHYLLDPETDPPPPPNTPKPFFLLSRSCTTWRVYWPSCPPTFNLIVKPSDGLTLKLLWMDKMAYTLVVNNSL